MLGTVAHMFFIYNVFVSIRQCMTSMIYSPPNRQLMSVSTSLSPSATVRGRVHHWKSVIEANVTSKCIGQTHVLFYEHTDILINTYTYTFVGTSCICTLCIKE